jgi:prepilin-type N-terminal cleavage/methylation domain-containing protein/prepilin-type processing-associated H-X9-DG protein
MRNRSSTSDSCGFSLIELLCVIAIIAILAAMLLPAIVQGKLHAQRLQCVSHLRQVGIAFHSFAHDHESLFPMAVSVQNGGSLEYTRGAAAVSGNYYFSYRHFLAISNELGSPQVLTCPRDTRLPAQNFSQLNNERLSYLVGVNARYGKANDILSGDRNLTNDMFGSNSRATIAPNVFPRWTRELHEFKGNLLYADGRVEQAVGARVRPVEVFAAQLALPAVKSGASSVALTDPSINNRPRISTDLHTSTKPASSQGPAFSGADSPQITNRSPATGTVTSPGPASPQSPDSPQTAGTGLDSLLGSVTGIVRGIHWWLYLLLLLIIAITLYLLRRRKRKDEDYLSERPITED